MYTLLNGTTCTPTRSVMSVSVMSALRCWIGYEELAFGIGMEWLDDAWASPCTVSGSMNGMWVGGMLEGLHDDGM